MADIRAGFGIKMRGALDVMRVFEMLPLEIQKKVIRPALTSASRPIIAAAKKNLDLQIGKDKDNTGALRESLGVVAAKKKVLGSTLSVIGARGPLKRGDDKGSSKFARIDSKGNRRVPSFYAHLVEFGHRQVRGGRLKPSKGKTKGRLTGQTIPPRAFLRPAVKSAGSLALKKGLRSMARGIEREAQKLSLASKSAI